MTLELSESVPEHCLWTGLGVPGRPALGPAVGEAEVSAA
jgi:hypothetical protein